MSRSLREIYIPNIQQRTTERRKTGFGEDTRFKADKPRFKTDRRSESRLERYARLHSRHPARGSFRGGVRPFARPTRPGLFFVNQCQGVLAGAYCEGAVASARGKARKESRPGETGHARARVSFRVRRADACAVPEQGDGVRTARRAPVATLCSCSRRLLSHMATVSVRDCASEPRCRSRWSYRIHTDTQTPTPRHRHPDTDTQTPTPIDTHRHPPTPTDPNTRTTIAQSTYS